jgi:hypothetical protein
MLVETCLLNSFDKKVYTIDTRFESQRRLRLIACQQALNLSMHWIHAEICQWFRYGGNIASFGQMWISI